MHCKLLSVCFALPGDETTDTIYKLCVCKHDCLKETRRVGVLKFCIQQAGAGGGVVSKLASNPRVNFE